MKHLFLSMAIILIACSSDKDQAAPLTSYQDSVIDYFKTVALGFEIGSASNVTRKWKDDVKIFVGGASDTPLRQELQEIVAEINALITDGVTISIITDSLNANCYIYFGSGPDFAVRYPQALPYVGTDWGLFFSKFDNNNFIHNAVIYVDIYRANAAEQAHLLREELTQSLGLAKDSPLYDNSIFQERWTTVTEYAPIDRDVIRLLYHPSMHVGLDAAAVEPVLQALVDELNVGA